MTSETFIDTMTVVPAAWLNDVNYAVYTTIPQLVALSSLNPTLPNLTVSSYVNAGYINAQYVLTTGYDTNGYSA